MKITKKMQGLSDYRDLLTNIDGINLKQMIGVYFVMNKGIPLYIGYSTNLQQRLYSHSHFIETLLETKKVDQISIKLFNEIKDAQNFERISIYKWKPLYNLAYTNSRVKMYDYIPFPTRMAIKEHYNANKDRYSDPGDVIVEMVNHYFKNNEQLQIA